MFRYVALVWDERSVDASGVALTLGARLQSRSTSWRQAWHAPGAQVLCSQQNDSLYRTHALSCKGVVLGALFRGAPNACRYDFIESIDEIEAQSIIDGGARALIARYWGDYIALFRAANERRVSVLKDPTGSLPCFLARQAGVSILFGCMSDALAMGIKFTADERFLRDWVITSGHHQGTDSLRGLTHIHGGECLNIGLDSDQPPTRRLLWTPLPFANGEPPADIQQAQRALRHVVTRATHAWARSQEQVLHRLSGGLDSSIVLACLASAPSKPVITCYTYFDPCGAMDERPWARLAARSAECSHLERPFDPSATALPDILAMQPTAYPLSYIGWLHRSKLERDLQSLTGARAVFCGDGGDSGFCSDSIALAVLEYLKRCGLHPFALKLSAQVGLRVELSAWNVLARSLRRWVLGSRMSDQREAWLRGADLLSAEARAELARIERYPHPWFVNERDVPWAVIRRMGQLLYPPEFYDPSLGPEEPGLTLIAPLYSQPVIETLLRIPMHMHFKDGRDRGLARSAFEGAVPAAILRRTWKDAAPGYFDHVIAANRPFLRELLLDGVLVQRRLLDRRGLEEALSERATQLRVLPGEILQHMDTEIWARQWC